MKTSMRDHLPTPTRWKYSGILAFCLMLGSIVNVQAQGTLVVREDNSTGPVVSNGGTAVNIGSRLSNAGTGLTSPNTLNKTFSLSRQTLASIIGFDAVRVEGEFILTSSSELADLSSPTNILDARTVTVQFRPSGYGIRAGRIIINYTENSQPYTFIVNLSAVATTSIASQLILNPAFTPTQDIPYIDHITDDQRVQVVGFTLQDGNGTSSDFDDAATKLIGITFSVNPATEASILNYALVTTVGTTISTQTSTNGIVTFSGLNITANDNLSTNFALAIRFKTTPITDNLHLAFTASAVIDDNGESFSQVSNTSPSLSSSANANNIEVTADRINFVNAQGTVEQDIDLNFSVHAADFYNNRDLDVTCSTTVSVKVDASANAANVVLTQDIAAPETQTLTRSFVAGLLTLNNYYTAQTAPSAVINVVPANTCLANLPVFVSGPFSIVKNNYAPKDFRTKIAGDYSDANIWERYSETLNDASINIANAATYIHRWKAGVLPAPTNTGKVYINHALSNNTASTLKNLVIPGQINDAFQSGTLTLGADITVTDNFELKATGSITGNAYKVKLESANVTVAGTLNNVTLDVAAGESMIHSLAPALTIPAGNTLSLSSGTLNLNGKTLTVEGPMTRGTTGLLKGSATSNLVINGSGEIVGGLKFEAGAQELNNLTLSRAGAAAGITLNSPLEINSTLALSNGILVTTTTNILTFKGNASFTGGSNNSYISGPAAKAEATTSKFIFTVGKAGVFAPAGVENSTAATTAEYIRTNPYLLGGLGPDVDRISGIEYWDVKAAPGGKAEVLLTYLQSRSVPTSEPGSVTGTANDLFVVHFTGSPSTWMKEGNAGASELIVNNITMALVKTGLVSSFSPFTFGENGNTNPLPVEMLSFDGKLVNSKVELNWVTASEKDNSHFDVQRSVNGGAFATIGSVKASGSENGSRYAFTDAKPAAGLAYYRLVQHDYDGTTSVFGPVKISYKSTGIVGLYPNPAAASATLSLDMPAAEQVQVRILNAVGQQVYQTTKAVTAGVNEVSLSVDQLANGLYIVEVTSAAGSQSLKLQKY